MEKAVPFLFLTNNSARSPKDFVTKLAHYGLNVSWKNFYTAGIMLPISSIRQQPNSASAYVDRRGRRD